jgi:hypothetical protein
VFAASGARVEAEVYVLDATDAITVNEDEPVGVPKVEVMGDVAVGNVTAVA